MNEQVREILKRLGGISAVADDLGVGFSTVHAWVRSGRVPPWRQKELIALAIKRGVTLSTADFPVPKTEKAA